MKNPSRSILVERVAESRGQESLTHIVSRVQDIILSQYSHVLLEARRDTHGRERLRTLVSQLLFSQGIALQRLARESLAEEVTNEIVGYGPIDPPIHDPEVTEVLVNGPSRVYVEKGGVLHETDIRFRDDDHLLDIIGRVVTPLGRRLDQSCPYVDARLPGGARVNAIIPPLALNGPVLTVRKFTARAMSMADFLRLGTLNEEMADFLSLCVRARNNVVISGGGGTGKTTTLNILSSFFDLNERVITIEDSAELKLNQPHVVSLESRPPNMEGRGEVTIRDLVRNALRMRPDRIVVGECRGPEAFDMLQALNTGHSGSLTTVHANGPVDALRRLENMALMAGEGVPHRVIREQLRAAVDVIIHLQRMGDGSRRITSIATVRKKGTTLVEPVFAYVVSRPQGGQLSGTFQHYGDVRLPAVFLQRLRAAGLGPLPWMTFQEEGGGE